jgi:hypothetical protein
VDQLRREGRLPSQEDFLHEVRRVAAKYRPAMVRARNRRTYYSSKSQSGSTNGKARFRAFWNRADNYATRMAGMLDHALLIPGRFHIRRFGQRSGARHYAAPLLEIPGIVNVVIVSRPSQLPQSKLAAPRKRKTR